MVQALGVNGMGQSLIAAFRSMKHDPIPRRGGDDLPGREIASELAAKLARAGIEVISVTAEEPWWAIRVDEQGRGVEVLVYIFSPHEDRSMAVWHVSVPSDESSFFGLFSKPESPARALLVGSVKAALSEVQHVYDIKWSRGD